MYRYAGLIYPTNVVWNIIEVEDKNQMGIMEFPSDVLTFVLLNDRTDVVEAGMVYNSETDLFE